MAARSRAGRYVSSQSPTILPLLNQLHRDFLPGSGGVEGLRLGGALQAHQHALQFVAGGEG